jgi:hypothetical protein
MSPIRRLLFAVSLSGLAAIVFLIPGCGGHASDPFSYVKVSGKLTYEDGTLIPGDVWVVFNSESEGIGRASPHPGMGRVNRNTGEFSNVTSHTANDGIVIGKHKVQVTDGNKAPLPKNVLAPEYSKANTTPLEVDTDHLPFILKVPKPKD